MLSIYGRLGGLGLVGSRAGGEGVAWGGEGGGLKLSVASLSRLDTYTPTSPYTVTLLASRW